MFFNPLEQFENFLFFDLFFCNLYFTNMTFFMVFSLSLFIIFFNVVFYNKYLLLIPTKWQLIFEEIYKIVLSILTDNTGLNAQKYFPWIFTLFSSVLIFNLSGLVPYSFTVTSHIIITFFLALSIFICVNFILIEIHGIKALSLFLPPGAPLLLAPLLVLIEIICHFIKVVSLSVRLFANMMSGHILLKVLLGFAWTMMTLNFALILIHIIPILVVFLLVGLELGIAMIQAYVFTILTCIYLNDVINLH